MSKAQETTARNGSTKWSKEPCMCMRVGSVQRHAKSYQHAWSVAKEHALLASGDSDIGSNLTSAARKQFSSNRQAVVGAMRSLYFLLKPSLPHTTVFGPFLDFCILQGCEYLSNLHLAGNAHYQSERIIHEFLAEFGTQVFRGLLSQLNDSLYIALMADETTDIAVTKELILYARYIVPTATPQQCVRSIFLQLSELSDGKANTITTAILELLSSLDLSINKVMGFGSDGASVMVGRKAGVATMLKEENPQIVAIHCVAHRLALAVAQSGDAMPYVKRFKVLLQYKASLMTLHLNYYKQKITDGYHMKVLARLFAVHCHLFLPLCNERLPKEVSIWQMAYTGKWQTTSAWLHSFSYVMFYLMSVAFHASFKRKV